MQLALKFEDPKQTNNIQYNKPVTKQMGQVFTNRTVVEFMLTAIGLNFGLNLDSIRILEPACGEGAFVIEVIKRLLQDRKELPTVSELQNCLRAFELDQAMFNRAKARARDTLLKYDYAEDDIVSLLESWFQCTDFLLDESFAPFTHVVGNPPYIRIEEIPKPRLIEYRSRFTTMTSRADIYIPFFEKSLTLLDQGGKLSFICTDRWMKNQYGKALRQFISHNYSLEFYIDLYDTDPFHEKVMTYPAITQIARTNNRGTLLLQDPTLSQNEATRIHDALNDISSESTIIRRNVVEGSAPWKLGSTSDVTLVEMIEKRFSTLEDAGCKVFIGAATGANSVFIIEPELVDVEASRLIPMISAKEISSGEICWKGRYLVNTFDSQGVVSLDKFPCLKSYLTQHKPLLHKRHIAKKSPSNWYRTIDRIHSERAQMKKLLIPDIGNTPKVVLDDGTYYPNNSIYYICSEEWDLSALRVILLSDITATFISMYSTKIANGFHRFQAQYLRKLRIPKWNQVSTDLQERLIQAGATNDTERFNLLASEVYGFLQTSIILGA